MKNATNLSKFCSLELQVGLISQSLSPSYSYVIIFLLWQFHILLLQSPIVFDCLQWYVIVSPLTTQVAVISQYIVCYCLLLVALQLQSLVSVNLCQSHSLQWFRVTKIICYSLSENHINILKVPLYIISYIAIYSNYIVMKWIGNACSQLASQLKS